jgi:hypothetical protein
MQGQIGKHDFMNPPASIISPIVFLKISGNLPSLILGV